MEVQKSKPNSLRVPREAYEHYTSTRRPDAKQLYHIKESVVDFFQNSHRPSNAFQSDVPIPDEDGKYSILNDVDLMRNLMGLGENSEEIRRYKNTLRQNTNLHEGEIRERSLHNVKNLGHKGGWEDDQGHMGQHHGVSTALSGAIKQNPFVQGFDHRVPDHGNILIHGQTQSADSSHARHVVDHDHQHWSNPHEMSHKQAVHNIPNHSKVGHSRLRSLAQLGK